MDSCWSSLRFQKCRPKRLATSNSSENCLRGGRERNWLSMHKSALRSSLRVRLTQSSRTADSCQCFWLDILASNSRRRKKTRRESALPCWKWGIHSIGMLACNRNWHKWTSKFHLKWEAWAKRVWKTSQRSCTSEYSSRRKASRSRRGQRCHLWGRGQPLVAAVWIAAISWQTLASMSLTRTRDSKTDWGPGNSLKNLQEMHSSDSFTKGRDHQEQAVANWALQSSPTSNLEVSLSVKAQSILPSSSQWVRSMIIKSQDSIYW